MIKLIRTASDCLFAIKEAMWHIQILQICLKSEKPNWKYKRDLFTGDEIITISEEFYKRHSFSLWSAGYKLMED
jgi:hypothetical protein